MELAFVTSAVRRYWWLIAAVAVLGLAATLALGGESTTGYTSRAVLLVAAPSDSRQTPNSTEADRYVKGQLTVLSSEVLAERVAERLDGRITASAAARVTSFEHEALTDVVHVVVTTGDPQLSQDVGNAYLDVYFESLRTQIDDAQRPEIEQLDAELEEVRTELADVDEQIGDALVPFQNRDPVPTIEQIAPGLASQKEVVLTRYHNVLDAKNELNTNARLRVSSEVVQRATLPSEPTTSSSNLMRLVGLVVGAVFGVFLAMVVARMSSRVLGDDEVEALLERPLVGRMPYQRELRTDPWRPVVQSIADPARRTVRRLSIRAAGVERDPDAALTVLVTGTREGAGATTIAAAMSRQFSSTGARVLLVDAIGDRGAEAIAGEVEGVVGALMVTVDHGLAAAGLRRVRQAFRTLVDHAEAQEVDVVVVDGGPMLESTIAVQLARLCHVTVLAVPDDQDTASLVVAAGELRDVEVLPVWTMRHQVWDRISAAWARLRRRTSRRGPSDASPPPRQRPPARPPLADVERSSPPPVDVERPAPPLADVQRPSPPLADVERPSPPLSTTAARAIHRPPREQ